ncbi:MAG TPA: AAA family ATPase [Candidatus Aerophobetes bacterium]|uniref:AAA family ATPase n=1 Tax=Aerophobetes bacterium TaxID=2030807 RepID=A0A7V0QRW3_UNCAE|nr:AAA family ATPase [Candidatus Aerophobetes bacterium]
MYEQYWNLREKPFQNTPDPRFLYLSSQHEDALMKLTYVVAQNLGAGLLTGVFGCGKTLLAKVILKDLGQQKFCTAYISNPLVGEPSELIRAIVRALSPQQLPEKKTELLIDPLLEKLHNILVDNIREGKENIVIIDEAHTINDTRIFEQLRLILNFQTEEKFLLTLLILGQPELKSKIEAIKPLAQRIPIRCHLEPLSEEEVAGYIEHRINVASQGESSSGLRPTFDKEATKIVYNYSGGIPRRINTLCDLVLLSGFAKKIEKIDAKFVESVIKEFNLS